MNRTELYNKFQSGSIPTETDFQQLIDAAVSIEIPKPQIEVKTTVANSTRDLSLSVLFCRWAQENTEFLNHQPELWLFRHKKNYRKSDSGLYYTKKSKWAHCPHLKGTKHGSSAYYSGAAATPVATVTTTGRKTEFPIVSTSGTAFKVDVSVTDWFYYKTAAGAFPALPTKLNVPAGTYRAFGARKLRFPVRFAIVITNPNSNDRNPKLIGELSDVVYFQLKNGKFIISLR